MSNKQQLQTNNEKYASLIETLRGKAIPSGSEDLDTELTEQENLISQLSTILDSKANGGGNIDTCTVTVGVTPGSSVYCAYTKYENDTITYEAMVPSATLDTVGDIRCYNFTLTNVVRNSTIFVQQSHSGTNLSVNNVELLQQWDSGSYFMCKPSDDGYIILYD